MYSVLVVIPSLGFYILLILCSISVVRSGQIRFILSVKPVKRGQWVREVVWIEYPTLYIVLHTVHTHMGRYSQ